MTDVDGLSVVGEDDETEFDVRVAPPSDPSAYVAANAWRADTLLALGGPYRVVVTFARPVSVDTFRATTGAPGVLVAGVEALGVTSDDQILTVGGDAAILAGIEREFEMRNAKFTGIVAADVVIASRGAYQALAASADVLIADVSAEVVARRLATERPELVGPFDGRIDVILDDLYWVTGELPT